MKPHYDRSNSQLVAVCMFCATTQTVDYYEINTKKDRNEQNR